MSCSVINNLDKWYIGLDVHKNYSYMNVSDQVGYVQYHGKFNHRDDSLIPALLQWRESKPIEAVLESTYGWYWLAERMEKEGVPFNLAHPQKVNAIAGKKKTDQGDAKILSDLLRTNMLPKSYIPSLEERSLKELLRFRLYLVRSRSTVKRRLRDILAKQNLYCPYRDILGQKAVGWLINQRCPFPFGDEIDLLLSQASHLAKQIDTIKLKVTDLASANPRVKLLESIPGIGPILGLTLVTEIGNVTRFANNRALASYAGVVPSVKSSGGKTYLGPTAKHGNTYIRWALAEAVTHLKAKDPSVKQLYERVKTKKGCAGKARMAAMNKLIRIIYSMLSKNQTYQIRTSTGN